MITALQAESATLSFELHAYELLYRIYQNQAEQDSSTLACGAISYDPNATQSAIQATLEQQPELALPYAEVILHHTPIYAYLAPEEMYRDEEPSPWQACLAGAEQSDSLCLVPYHLKEQEQVICAAQHHALISALRTLYPGIQFVPSYASKLKTLISLARREGRGQLLLYLDYAGITIAYTEAKGISLLNRYPYTELTDARGKRDEAIYYLSIILETLQTQTQSVGLHIQPDSIDEADMESTLRNLIFETH